MSCLQPCPQPARGDCVDAAGGQFDAVVASEVIEHVSNVPDFCASLVALTRPGGSVVVSTINRTNRSYAVAIIGAEQIMGLLPIGTHQWDRFITPGNRTLSIQDMTPELHPLHEDDELILESTVVSPHPTYSQSFHSELRLHT